MDMHTPATEPRRYPKVFHVRCGRCGYRDHLCQCDSTQRPAEFRVLMRLSRDDHGLPALVPGLVEPFKYMCACGHGFHHVELFADHRERWRNDAVHYNVAPWAIAERADAGAN